METRRNIGNIIPATMAASALMGLIASMSFFMVSLTSSSPAASMELSPTAAVVNLNHTFNVSVTINSRTPINAFTGLITFDNRNLQVEKIDYNTSIADLWAEEPWYKNGDGTIHFAGGTTVPGGFIGEGTVLNITFRSINSGSTQVNINHAQILKHDGLGSEATLSEPIDAIFTVTNPAATNMIMPEKETDVVVRDPNLRGDLNGDGTVTIADVSMLFVYLTKSDLRGDLNSDGRISTVDLSIIIGQL